MSDDLIGTIWVGVALAALLAFCVWRGDLDVEGPAPNDKGRASGPEGPQAGDGETL